ncbi:MAG: hypothetical protein QXI35_08620 [Candidatus Nezhaarchaeales archaeon]
MRGHRGEYGKYTVRLSKALWEELKEILGGETTTCSVIVTLMESLVKGEM